MATPTVEELQARLDKLNKLIASGVSRSRHGDTEVANQNLDDLLKARADLEKQIAAAGPTPRPRLRYAYQSGKGL